MNIRIEVMINSDKKTAEILADKIFDLVEETVDCEVVIMDADTGEEL